MKYRPKGPDIKPGAKITIHAKVCIHCGAEETYTKVENPGGPPRPRPDTTGYLHNGSRLQCLLGSHRFYFRDEVEKI